MCQEFNCECCSDDLPQLSCECIQCYHEDQLKTECEQRQTAEEDTSISKSCSVSDEKCCTSEEENGGTCCQAGDEIAEKNTDEPKTGWCSANETKACQPSSECCALKHENSDKKPDHPNEDYCATGNDDKTCQGNSPKKLNGKGDKREAKRPCASENVSCCSDASTSCQDIMAQNPDKACDSGHRNTDGTSGNDSSQCCENSQDKTCCSSTTSCSEKKATAESSEVNQIVQPYKPAKVDNSCGSSDATEYPWNHKFAQENEGEDKKCCQSKKKNPCCPSKSSFSKDEGKQLTLENDFAKSACYSQKVEKREEHCQSNAKTSCCSSESSSSFDTNKVQASQCQGTNASIKSSCCQNDQVSSSPCCSSEPLCSSSTIDIKPDEDKCKTEECCAEKSTASTVSDCCSNSKPAVDKPQCCSQSKDDTTYTCSVAQEVKCSIKDNKDEELDSIRNDECCGKDETVVLIGPPNEKTATKKTPKSSSRPHSLHTTKLRVQNICCAMEAQLVQDCLKPLEGIENVSVNVIGRVVHVRHHPEVTSPTDLVDCLNKVHLGATVMEAGAHHDNDTAKMPRMLKLTLVYVLIQAVLLLTSVCGLFLKKSWYQWVAVAEIVFGGAPILKNSFYAVKNRHVDINILMLIAIIGTIAISEWVEGATVVFVFGVAEVLQNYCMFRVQRTISKLMLKRPEIAVLVETGKSISIENVAVGTLIAVRPGELIPLDGIVVKGRAAVDESSITGEALPVEKTIMDKVFSGTVNQNGYIEVETTSDSSSSTVSKVAQMVQEAQSSSTETEAIINRFAKFYTPAVVLLSALLVIVPAILGAAGIGTYLQDIRLWGQRALVLLVISCPCALVMATPIAVVCSITAAARKGALVKGGEFLETLSKLEVLAFDKTGTLTEGKFQVTNMESAEGNDEREILRLAAGLESKTVHPISAAIVNEFSGCITEMVKNQTVVLPEVSSFSMHEGQGISGYVEGKYVRVGNKEMVEKCGASLNNILASKYQLWSSESKTVVFVCVDDQVSLMIALADEIRPNTSLALDWLRKLGVQTSMITGDNSRTAAAVKTKLALDDYVSEMKPSDKLEWIKDKQSLVSVHSHSRRICCCKPRAQNVLVGMVGDGVNDGPALATADVGIAMGAGGTALAVEAADVALMSNNLAKIPELINLAKFFKVIVIQNIGVSVILKLVIVIVALSGYVTLWMAVIADVLGLLLVIVNGLRPLTWKPPKSHRKKHLDVELGMKTIDYKYDTIP